MGFGQHRHLPPGFGPFQQRSRQLRKGRFPHLLMETPKQPGRGCVVYVLRSETEMDELLVFGKLQRIPFLLQKIFHRLDIVVGGLLNLLHMPRILHRKVRIDAAQLREQGDIHPLQFRQRPFAQRDEILNLHQHPRTDECIFRKVFRKRPRLPVIASVYRGYCCQCIQFHIFTFLSSQIVTKCKDSKK